MNRLEENSLSVDTDTHELVDDQRHSSKRLATKFEVFKCAELSGS